MNAPDPSMATHEFKNHDIVDDIAKPGVRYEKRPAKTPDGKLAPGLFNAWITLDNPTQYNSYTTDMVKGVILAMRAASNARDVNCVVFTGAGDKAFCTGGNTKEYAEYYAGQPQEYRQYMRLFNDMVSAILACDKPVICRVNGMRIGGGQEIGMACDFSVAQDLARFGQAGPKHGSAPIGGATDFLPVVVGAERAMAACVLCEPFSAHKAYQMGILTDIVPALKVDGEFVANPLVETQRLYDAFGRIAYGEPVSGDALATGKALIKRGTVDLAMLDARVEELCAKILLTFPDCTTKTLEELRKPKLEAWNRNKEDSRSWLALNMMT
ncbi:MAG: 6-oxocyclohex-1-ene-1-carbonyl-CoA hydratase, partial [Rubrivivax sp.]